MSGIIINIGLGIILVWMLVGAIGLLVKLWKEDDRATVFQSGILFLGVFLALAGFFAYRLGL